MRTATVTRRDPPRLAFLFTGQGAQYPDMSKGLYEASPVFRAALDRCAAILAPHLDRPLLDVVFPADAGSALLDATEYTQPALFAVEYALTELWRPGGHAVRPDRPLGRRICCGLSGRCVQPGRWPEADRPARAADAVPARRRRDGCGVRA